MKTFFWSTFLWTVGIPMAMLMVCVFILQLLGVKGFWPFFILGIPFGVWAQTRWSER